jgi:hypothetical protein
MANGRADAGADKRDKERRRPGDKETTNDKETGKTRGHQLIL